MKTRQLVALSVSVIAIVAFGLVTAPLPTPHANCNVVWDVSVDCDTVLQKLVDQINLWSGDDCGTPDNMNMKCMYELQGVYGRVIKGTHTTWDFGYIDDIDFMLTTTPEGCSINGRSWSQVLSIGDFSVNYCNVYNLVEGAGLTEDPSFNEFTVDNICTLYSQRNCSYY